MGNEKMKAISVGVVCVVLSLCLSTLLSACGGENESGGGGSRDEGPERIAKDAVQALIDGDRERFTELLRPDYRGNLDLRGYDRRFYVFECTLDGAQILAEEPVPGSATDVTVVFAEPCGGADEAPVETCTVRAERLSGQWYINFANC